MIAFGPMSITLLICAMQGVLLAVLLARTKTNRAANRWLALLIAAVVALMTPYIIGYAGFYDRWPWLSFAPVSLTLAFGPLLYLYTVSLVEASPARVWPHFLPVTVQFLAYALVFPFPLPVKDRWNDAVHEPFIDPAFDFAALVSIAVYGAIAYRRYRTYRQWLDENRTDSVDFDPVWIRNFLVALVTTGAIWAGFLIAKRIDPARDYFDQFPLYVGYSLLVLYLGIAGWRHAETRFPQALAPPEPEPTPPASAPLRDWAAQGEAWIARIDAEQLWRDPALTLASLARTLGTNTTYLSRALGAASGENFNAIINRRRVAAIQALLAVPGEERDLLTLALDAGFNSKASFNRAFREFAGMNPSAWRSKSQKSLPV
ncbi:helix-turn-helix domain-containing protein [Erythrobacter sp. BLCC-B19]|uniref:helix-turn-helix domain-containing protein n=1 Tax=Erythrobacter sp. BLCC-B19 TaxID=3025315 RepID=UPI0023615D87|nr:helix-turn-helix transcriptional regulator [Erythrobacter sp. BLCC-B19]WDA40596.1 helix-turn-helix transcriptional regulator [Erythrobacter sp. BLCC-B19]